jgi:serine/threonine-protein kinase
MSDPIARLNEALVERYAIERELGQGGMATVYLARDLKHNRSVALKVLKPELAAVVGSERFLAEIETTANLQHPNILPLYDSGEADSFLYYVMPYVDGETLRERLETEKQLPVEEAVRIATAVANALDFAHEHGVVHRDIKPGNILFQAGQPVVGDFGIALAVGAGGGARLTETGLSVGTPYYMSPEQATGDQRVGARSDIYSLGCVLYEMLVGDPPYLGSTAQAVLGQIISGKPVSTTEKRSAVPVHVDASVRKALERVPADRFATAAELAAALANPGFRHGEGATQGAAVARSRGLNGALAATTVVLAAALGWTILQPRGPDPQPAMWFDFVPTPPLVQSEWGVAAALRTDAGWRS